MQLKINLADREEVAAGHALLAAILGGALTMPTAGHAITHTVTHAVGNASVTEALTGSPAVIMPIYQELQAAQAADTRAPLSQQQPDPAAIFGGLPTPGPTATDLGRPLTAAEAPAATFGAANVPLPPAATVPPPPVGSVELDTKGLPWDERIHAGSKAKVKDGSWRMKKELDPALVTAVEAELRARLGNAAPVAAPTATTPAPVMTAGASLPITSALPPVAAAAEPVTFEQIMPRITAGVTAGILPATAIAQACAANGLPSVVALQTSPQYVPFVWATLKQSYPGLQ